MDRKAIIKLGYACNNRCVFCHATPKKIHSDLSLETVQEKILRLKDLGINMAVFSGGEPTIRKDIIEIFRFSHKNGFKTGLITNGRMLQYEKIVLGMKKQGLGYVYTSLHGPEGIHNMMTRANGFRQTLRGIKNISGLEDVELVVNCVVTSLNLDSLNYVVDSLNGMKVDMIKFSLVEPLSYTAQKITPDINNAWDSVREAIRYGEKMGFNVGVDGFPLCILKSYDKYLDNLKTNNIVFISETFEDDFFASDVGNKIKDDICKSCKLEKTCEGVYKEYLHGLRRHNA